MNFYNVPAGIAVLVVQRKSFREFQVYIVLKKICSGQISLTGDIIETVGVKLGISESSVRRSIYKLKKRNWIGHDRRRKMHFIRGFDSIRVIERIPSTKSYRFYLKDIKKLKGFLIASCYAQIIDKMRKRRLAEVRVSWGTTQKVNLPSFFPVALLYLAKVCKCAKSTASIYRKIAESDGFITVKPILNPLIRDDAYVEESKLTGLKMDKENGHRLVVRGRYIYQQETSRIRHYLKSKRRKHVLYQKRKKVA